MVLPNTLTRRECFRRMGAVGCHAFLGTLVSQAGGCARSHARGLEKISIGVSPSLTACLEHVAQDRGFFVEQGLDVDIRTYSSGVAGIVAMLDGTITAASSTAIPVVMQVLAGSDFRIVATLASMANDNWLVARRDAGIGTVRDLTGKRVGCLKGGMPQFVLDLLLMKHNMTSRDIVASFGSPPDLIVDLVEKRLDAVVVFGHYLDEIRERLRDNTVFFGDKLLAVLTSYLTVGKDFSRQRPDTIQRLLLAYVQAERFAAAYPDEAVSIAARSLKMEIAKVRQAWPDCLFHIGLQQHLLSDLEDKAAWANTRENTTAAAIPNFLGYFDCQALEHIEPSRVSIIRAGGL